MNAAKNVRLYVPKADGNAQFARKEGVWVKPTYETVTIGGKPCQVQSDTAVEDSDSLPAGTGCWVENASGADVTVR